MKKGAETSFCSTAISCFARQCAKIRSDAKWTINNAIVTNSSVQKLQVKIECIPISKLSFTLYFLKNALAPFHEKSNSCSHNISIIKNLLISSITHDKIKKKITSFLSKLGPIFTFQNFESVFICTLLNR